MEKIKVTDFFGGMSHVSLNHIRVTPNNIDTFELYLRYADETQRFYTTTKNDKGKFFIYHNLKENIVDWAEGLHSSIFVKQFPEKSWMVSGDETIKDLKDWGYIQKKYSL